MVCCFKTANVKLLDVNYWYCFLAVFMSQGVKKVKSHMFILALDCSLRGAFGLNDDFFIYLPVILKLITSHLSYLASVVFLLQRPQNIQVC